MDTRSVEDRLASLEHGFEAEAHERLAALEADLSTTKERLTGHHVLAQKLQTDSGIYNGILQAQEKLLTILEERMRLVEATQAAREVRLRPLEDDLMKRSYIRDEKTRWAKTTAIVIRIVIGLVSLFVGWWYGRRTL